jgi:hypothetical protein
MFLRITAGRIGHLRMPSEDCVDASFGFNGVLPWHPLGNDDVRLQHRRFFTAIRRGDFAYAVSLMEELVPVRRYGFRYHRENIFRSSDGGSG